MALIMYFTRAPKYENMFTGEYETIPRKDIKMIEQYFDWTRAKYEGTYYCSTLKEWCGVSEDDIPDKYHINYYNDFYTIKKNYMEYVGEVESYSIFEFLARVGKNNALYNWCIDNVMNGNMDGEHYEVSEDKLRELFMVCKNVADSFTLLQEGKEKYGNKYDVNKDIAEKFFPIMNEDRMGLFYGPKEYNNDYAIQVVELVDILSNIIETTDFEKQVVYVNATSI